MWTVEKNDDNPEVRITEKTDCFEVKDSCGMTLGKIYVNNDMERNIVEKALDDGKLPKLDGRGNETDYWNGWGEYEHGCATAYISNDDTIYVSDKVDLLVLAKDECVKDGKFDFGPLVNDEFYYLGRADIGVFKKNTKVPDGLTRLDSLQRLHGKDAETVINGERKRKNFAPIDPDKCTGHEIMDEIFTELDDYFASYDYIETDKGYVSSKLPYKIYNIDYHCDGKLIVFINMYIYDGNEKKLATFRYFQGRFEPY